MNIQQSFQVLGLSRSASLQAAKSAYRKLVKTYHPDRFVHDPDKSRAAEETIKQINDAYGQVRSYFTSKGGRQHVHATDSPASPQDLFRKAPSAMTKKRNMHRTHPERVKQPPVSFSTVLKDALLSQERKAPHSHGSRLRHNMFRHVVSNYYSYAYSRNSIRKPFGPIQEVKPVPPVAPVRPLS